MKSAPKGHNSLKGRYDVLNKSEDNVCHVIVYIWGGPTQSNAHLVLNLFINDVACLIFFEA
jgi:hypothetical protein